MFKRINWRSLWWLLPGIPLAFFTLFYFYPLLSIFNLSFTTDGKLDLSPLNQLFSTSYYAGLLWFTTWQAVISTLLTLLCALPGAYVFARYQFRGKGTLLAVSTLPFVLPTVVVAAAFTALFGRSGVLNVWLMQVFDLTTPPIQIEQTIWIIFLAHIFFNYSVALRMISSYWSNLDPDLANAAQLLGASPQRAFWTVTLPLLRPAVTAAAVLVFIFSFTSFGVILILGGPRFATLEVAIYRQTAFLFNLPVAAALSIIQIAFTFLLMWLYTRTQSRVNRPKRLRSAMSTVRPISTRRDRLIVSFNLVFMLALLAFPLAALVLRSFAGPNGWTALYYRELFVNRQNSLFFVPPATAVFNSLLFAVATVVLAVSLGLMVTIVVAGSGRPTRRRGMGWVGRLLDPLFMLPLATSAVTLGFGYIISLDKPPLNLRSSIVLVPIAHTLVAMPFVIRSTLPAVRRIAPSLREAAGMLGAEPQRVWLEIDWPLIRRALLVGAVFAFTVSMGEFGATLFIARPQTPTMPVAIFRFLGRPGALNYGQALAMSTLLMLVCAAGFIVIERFRLGNEGEF
ncbi:MAG: iron ABC transporter permease [Anaerolineae bacterium]|nr:iron ABC transporter permease [Anaerolineae bacterium]